MSNWNGRMGKGAKRIRKEERRMEAAVRDTKTKPERKSKKGQAK